MFRFAIRTALPEAVAHDEARYDDAWAAAVQRTSGLKFDRAIAKAYGRWFVGTSIPFRWTWERGAADPPIYRQSKGRIGPSQVGDHLRPHTAPGGFTYALHSQSKCEECKAGPFFWTRYLAVDLDRKGSDSQSLADRYAVCVRLFGQPLALRSRTGGGLHLYWPLRKPMSIFGFTARGSRGLPVLIPALLRQEGLDIRPGNVEVFPQMSHTLRMPLAPCMLQLDPISLEPLAQADRVGEIVRLVRTIEALAQSSPLDVERLPRAASVRPPVPVRNNPHAITPRPSKRRISPAPVLDVDRLEREGLYAPGTRNAAAMVLARQMMVVWGYTAGETVRDLMRWTRDKHNGFSKDAQKLHVTAVWRQMEKEYWRICQGIEHAIRAGILERTRGDVQPWSRALTAEESDRIFTATESLPIKDRYWFEVFLFSLVGYCRDHGKPTGDPDQRTALVEVHADLSSAVLQRLPRCSAGRYRGRLTWSVGNGFVRMVRNYRHSSDPRRSRCRTYAAHIDLVGKPLVSVPGRVLLRTARRLRARGRRRHPRQLEHAVTSRARWKTELPVRYGKRSAREILALAEAVDGASAGGAEPEPNPATKGRADKQ